MLTIFKWIKVKRLIKKAYEEFYFLFSKPQRLLITIDTTYINSVLALRFRSLENNCPNNKRNMPKTKR